MSVKEMTCCLSKEPALRVLPEWRHGTQYSDTQYNDIQQNDIQHNNNKNAKLSIVTFCTITEHCHAWCL